VGAAQKRRSCKTVMVQGFVKSKNLVELRIYEVFDWLRRADLNHRPSGYEMRSAYILCIFRAVSAIIRLLCT